MKRVAIFRASLLARSETFIRDQASALHSWRPTLVGFWRVEESLSTPGVPQELVPVGRWWELRCRLARPIPRLVERIRDLQVGLVHAHFGPDAFLAWPSVKAAGVPLLVTLHGYDITIGREWWEAGHGGRLMRLYPRRLLQMAQHPLVRFVAVSVALRQRAIAYGIPKEKISVAYTGVDISRFKPGGTPIMQRHRRILFVGRMVEKKGPLLMIRAFAAVRAQMPGVQLAMVGDGPLLQEAQELAGELGVPVEFCGALTSDEVLAQMHKARVLCLPSFTASNGDAEGFGMVLLEAQACGVPVVTSALGGAQEGLIDGRTGYAFREQSLDELVAKLGKFLGEPAAAALASAEAPQFVAESFDINRCSRVLEQIYDVHSLTSHRA